MNKLVIAISLFFLCFLSILLLYFYSNRDSNHKNGFKRKFSKISAIVKESILLDDDQYSFAEITDNELNVYKYKKPSELLRLTKQLKQINPYKLRFTKEGGKIKGLNKVFLSDTSKILLAGLPATAYVIGPNSYRSSKLDITPFYQSEILSSNSFVFITKTKLQGIYRRKLKKVNWQGNELNSYYPEKQIDGYFCTDGQLNYEKSSRFLVYMYFYRGIFDCLDTNLNLKYQAKTIDTVLHAKLFLQPLKELVHGKLDTIAIIQKTPPNLVNKRLSVSGDRIYIHSNLKADNENVSDFNRFDVIDVYNLRNGHYLESFYLIKFGRQKLTEFKVYKKKLYALYHNTLVGFDIGGTGR
jgi:hypothetical protein